jgi:hypothetical protein
MESSHTADLDIPELNAAASKAHVFPGMANHSLLSIGKLCDKGYIFTLKQDTVTICNSRSSQILSGPRDVNTGLWRINLRTTNNHKPEPISNNVYELSNTGALVHYLHKALFSPTKSAMLQAVKDGHLITWPGLTEDAINKYLKLTPATAMGHMNQRRQNIRSTSKAPIEKQQTPDTDLGTNTHIMYAVVVDQGQLYTDLTGKFPLRSSKGNSYVMVCYIYDCNYVKVIPMKSRSASEWVKSYDSVHQELTVKGFKQKFRTLDNEASAALKTFFTVNDIAYQLVPPHCHLRNAAERAIRTFKEHFVAGLSSVDPSFPMHLWYRLLPHAEITLNLLRTLATASTALCRCALPWSHGLQQDSFCNNRMQNHCTQETMKAANLGSPQAAWILIGSRNAPLPVSKCIHLDHGQRTHRGHSRILSPQLSNATVIVYRPIANGSQRHDGCFTKSSSGSLIRQRRG